MKEMINKKIDYIEHLRVFAMLSVVLIHSCITAITDFPESSYKTLAGVGYYAVRNFCHFAVPVFFMITGTLLLNPNKEIPLKKLINKYILRYLIVILVFGWGFSFMEEIFKNKSFSSVAMATSFINMLQGKTWNHMWYLYTLVGLMLLLPIEKVIVTSIEKKEQKYIGVVLFICTSIIPFLEGLVGIEIGIMFPIVSVYFFYIVLGYWLSCFELQVKYRWICWLVILITLVVSIYDAYCYIMLDVSYNLAVYNSPFIVVLAAAIYILFKRQNFSDKYATIWNTKIIPFLSKHSFCVYIIHMFWINIVYKLLRLNPFTINALLGILMVWIGTVCVSVLSSVIIHKIPYLNRII